MAVSTFLHIGVYWVSQPTPLWTWNLVISPYKFASLAVTSVTHTILCTGALVQGSLIDPLDLWWDAKFSRREGHAISTKSTKM